MNFFVTKVYHFIHHAKRKATTIYKRGIKKITAKYYKERSFKDYVEVTYFIKAQKVK